MSPRRSSASRAPSGRCTPGRRSPGASTRSGSSRTTARRRSTAAPRCRPTYVWARQVARRIEQLRRAAPERPCHNDLLNANFIDDGRRVRIVDWEYAGMGDVFFDLANFAINHELDARRSRGAARGVLRRGAARPAARARADAVHVRLPRGDVGRRADRPSHSSTSTSPATPPSTSSGCSARPPSRSSSRRSRRRWRGAPTAPPRTTVARPGSGLRRQVELAEPLLLEPLELLLGAHRAPGP